MADDRGVLLQKANKFLQEDDVRNASTQRKRSFLQSKGLSDREIESLLSTEPSLEPSTNASSLQEVKVPEKEDRAGRSEENSIGLRSQDTPDTPNSQDSPPIITYPEFLLQSQKPPPLITAQRLLTAGYAISGAAAVLYGTSKYLIEPLLESMSTASHSLYETAHSNVKALNEKLEQNVSVIPVQTYCPKEEADLDDEGVDEDGARFFSRTVATQTSPQLSQSPSHSSITSAEPPSTPASQASQLLDIQTKLQNVKASDESDKSLKAGLDELQSYLDGLPDADHPPLARAMTRSVTNDSVSKMKAEIRGVKGVLLSARNFPTSTAR